MNWALERTAAGIERRIPPGCQNQSAIEALRCVALAREAATEAKQAYWIVDAMAHFKDYQLWEDAVRGSAFTGNTRGLSRLYRETVEVLKRMGADTPAKLVRHELELAGVIRGGDTLHWTDDKGRSKSTTVKQFENNLSRLRDRLR